MKEIRLFRVSYSPGYCDMLGEYHDSTLKKGKEGGWTYVCTDRETHDQPAVKTAYAVSPEAVIQFEEFIKNEKVLSLEKRPKSDLFATDYSPWNWNIDYETTSFGKTKREYCSIGEYKKYSARDYDLLRKLENQFRSLRGKKISEECSEEK